MSKHATAAADCRNWGTRGAHEFGKICCGAQHKGVDQI